MAEHQNNKSAEALVGRLRGAAREFWFAQTVKEVVQAGVFDLIAKNNAPTAAANIAKETNLNTDVLYRSLRVLASEGLFSENTNQEFELTEAGRMLVSGHPSHLRECVIGHLHEYLVRPWVRFDHTLKTGEIAFDKEYGHPFFETFSRSPGFAALFEDLMRSFTIFTKNAGFGDIIGDAKKIIDVGGATGVLLVSILRGLGDKANNLEECVVYELPKVVESVHESGMKDVPEEFKSKFRFEAGNFFEGPITPGGDIYVLKSIIHDWSDENAIKILKNVHAAIQKRPEAPARLWLVEGIISAEPNVQDHGRWLDLHMAVMVGGKERTLAQWTELLSKAGFKLERAEVPVGDRYYVIEATPVF